MNTKQAKRLRKAIREKYPNIDKSVFEKIYNEAKRQYGQLNAIERAKEVIEIK